MKKILLSIGILLCLFLLFIVFLLVKDPNPDRPATIETPNGYVQAVGTNLYDGDGNLLTLNGTNFGNWFVMEEYMSVASVGDYDTGIYTKKRGLAAMKDNPNLTDEQILELNDLFMDSYIQETDFKEVSDLGLNVIRINFTYMDLTDEKGTLKENAFQRLDWCLEMCEKYGLYAILDLHGAYGSQNKDNHSGDDSQYHLYDSDENRVLTIKLWETIAGRYKERKIVAAYDLLNECRRDIDKFGGKVNTDFYDELYHAVRKVDPNHMIMIEYFSFPFNGAPVREYGWENICVEYHIYNLSPFPQLACLYFYKALHNLWGNQTPVYIGEWCAWNNKEDWIKTLAFFDQLGWSHSSWVYKWNNYKFAEATKEFTNFGIYELTMEPIDLHTATFEEIAEAFQRTSTKYAHPTLAFDVFSDYY
ncbi:MAG: cellulase family glycosylhydrolase [Blautia sp.]|nr:cellulase family glycosylhydrolase [Blautia sp.]